MGELRQYPYPDVFEYNVGQVVDKDGRPRFDDVRASDAIIVAINYKTGLAWLEPARG